LVLFSPIGTPAQDASFTAKGKGNPVARLESTAVSPNGTPGLSATGQAANATIAGNGTLNAVTAGANSGLTQLAAGVGQLVAGLESLKSGADQLHTGLATGADGTNQLATGLHSAHDGSGKLDTGLGQLNAGTGKLVAGTNALHDGSDKLVAGLQKASDGSKQLVGGSEQLATGAGLTAAGATKLSQGLPQLVTGLSKVDAGLATLGTSLPAGLAGGQQQVKDAIKAFAVNAYIGDSATKGTLLGGIAQLSAGLSHPAGAPGTADPGGVKEVLTSVLNGLDAPPSPLKPLGGAKEALTTVQSILGCSPKAERSPCTFVSNSNSFPKVPAPVLVQQVLVGALAGLGDRQAAAPTALFALQSVVTGIGTPTADQTLLNGLALLKGGLDHPSAKNANGTLILNGHGKPVDPGGLKQFLLEQIDGGIDKVTAGVTAGLLAGLGSARTSPATTLRGGVAALTAGGQLAADGSAKLADGTQQVAAGADKLSKTGAVPISGGLGQLLAGGQKLDAGAGQLNSGAGQLNTGAGAAHTGSSALNDGLAKISAGEDKLAAGLPAAVTGSGKISDGAGKLLAGDKAVGAGLVGVKSKATSVLASQLSSGTENSKLQLAGLEATTARLTSDPAANTAYVLTQEGSTSGLKLAGNQSHVGRNIGLGVGGVLLLLAGLAVGFLGGRRRKVA